MNGLSYASLAVALAASWCTTAHAQTEGGANAKSLLETACANLIKADKEGDESNAKPVPLSKERLAEVIFAEATFFTLDALDYIPVRPMTGTPPDTSYEGLGHRERIRWLAWQISREIVDEKKEKHGLENQIFQTIDNIEVYLFLSSSQANSPVKIVDRTSIDNLPMDEGLPVVSFLFDPKLDVQIECTVKAAKEKSAIIPIEFKPPYRPNIAFRKTPEGFTVGGKKRLTADAATFGYEKEWDFDDTNDVDRKSSYTFDGALGIRLSEKDKLDSSYAFVRYQLDKDRSFPKKELEEGERRDTEDTNTLALGFITDQQILGLATKNIEDATSDTTRLFWVGSVSYVIDFPKDRERIRSRHLFEFVSPNLRNPICGFGYGRPLGILDLSGRCQFQIDLESGIQTRTGRADPTVFDDYAGIGANFTFEAFTELDDKQQVIISANGRYVPIIAGTAPDLWKIAVSAKRRYWVSEFIGFDFGVEFSDGRNELTQEEEKKLAIGLGVIL